MLSFHAVDANTVALLRCISCSLKREKFRVNVVLCYDSQSIPALQSAVESGNILVLHSLSELLAQTVKHLVTGGLRQTETQPRRLLFVFETIEKCFKLKAKNINKT